MHVLFVIPGDINLPTGGYRYDREIISAWKASNINVKLVSLEGNYPFPSEADKTSAIKAISNFPYGDIAVVDGLLGGVSPDFLKALSKHMPVVALIHHPLCLENGLDNTTAKMLEASERKGLEFVSSIITTSDTTAQTAQSLFGFDTSNIHSVPPGVDRVAKSKGSGSNTVHLLCIGSVIARKGHKYLIQALAKLKHLNWKLDCYGNTEFDPELFTEITQLIADEGLSQKIKFHGTVSDKRLEEAYHMADIFVLPSLYEGYGMVYAEAIIRGIPVIGTTAGAIPKTVPKTCGILVEPENIKMLTDALNQLITDKKIRLEFAEGARKSEPNFPTWEGSAHKFAHILRKLT